MSDTEPPSSDGQPEPTQPKNGGRALSRWRTVLRLLPPLVITREQCDEVVEALRDVL